MLMAWTGGTALNTSYWNLFWTTGMPEAWLMSRNQADMPKPAQRPEEPDRTADLRPGPTGGVSAGVRG